MSGETIKARIKEAFAKDNSFLDDYTSALRQNLQTMETRADQSTRAMLVLMVTYELLHRAVISEVAAFGLKFSDLSLIQKLLPLVIAYMYYVTSSLYVVRRLTLEAHDAAIELGRQELYENDLDCYMLPPSPFLTEEVIERGSKGVFSFLVGNLTFPLKLVIMFAPLVFGAYSYFVMFQEFGAKDVVIWLSLLVSVPFMLQGMFLYVGVDRLAPAA